MPSRSNSAPVSGLSNRVVTPAVSWWPSATRSTPENGFSLKIDSKLKSFGAESKFGRSLCFTNGVFAYRSRGSRVCRTVRPNQLASRSKVQALSTLSVGITRVASLRNPATGRSSE